MKITTTGRKIDITEGLRGYVDKKITKLEKYFQDSADAQVHYQFRRIIILLK